jgi:hypothetical protein
VAFDIVSLADLFVFIRPGVHTVQGQAAHKLRATYRILTISNEQESKPSLMVREKALAGNYVTKTELLDDIEEHFRVNLTSGWIRCFFERRAPSRPTSYTDVSDSVCRAPIEYCHSSFLLPSLISYKVPIHKDLTAFSDAMSPSCTEGHFQKSHLRLRLRLHLRLRWRLWRSLEVNAYSYIFHNLLEDPFSLQSPRP